MMLSAPFFALSALGGLTLTQVLKLVWIYSDHHIFQDRRISQHNKISFFLFVFLHQVFGGHHFLLLTIS